MPLSRASENQAQEIETEPALGDASTPGFVPDQKAEDGQPQRLKTLRQALKAVWKKDKATKASNTLPELRRAVGASYVIFFAGRG